MRRFKLINGEGKTFDLMRKDAFFNDPTGLGWGTQAEVMEVGDTYIVTDRKPQKPSPAGEMVFQGYDQYDEFLDFIQVGSLVLGYKPWNQWRYLDVDISIDRGEIDDGTRRLICQVSFSASSQWYEQLTSYQAVAQEGEGKVYAYTYPYIYKDDVEQSVKIHNGRLSSYPKLSIFGPVESPTWALYQYGVRLATGKVNAAIPAGHKLVVDMNPATMEIAEYTSEGIFVENRYQLSDFTTERLFELPPGDCDLVFTQGGTGSTKAFVEVRKRV